ncbi:hypothetical protein ACWX0P_30570 [Vibrio mediterranei]
MKKLLPPCSRSVVEVAKEDSTSDANQYNWRKQLRELGAVVPDSDTSSEQWSAQIKLAIVAETHMYMLDNHPKGQLVLFL